MLETIIINRTQSPWQSPSAYVSYYDSNSMLATNLARPQFAGLSAGEAPAFQIIYQTETAEMAALHAKISNYSRLNEGWNGYSAPAPSEKAILTAKNLVSHLLMEKNEPNRIAPSVVGGIGITHRRAGRRVYIEIYNDGRVFALFTDGNTEPETKEIEPGYQSFKILIAEMKDYLDG